MIPMQSSPFVATSPGVARRRGTVYIVTLSTAMIVTVMGVSGLLAVRVQHRAADLDRQMILARQHARSAADLAAWHVAHDPQWHALAEAERQVEAIGPGDGGAFSFRYVPTQGGAALGTSGCDPFWIEATGRHGQARARLRVLLEPIGDEVPTYRQALRDEIPLAHWPLHEAGSQATERLNDLHGAYRDVQQQVRDERYCLTAAGFDGAASVVEVPHDPAFKADDGAVMFWFRTGDPYRPQGLWSKDASGYGDGGHLTIRLANGRVAGRLGDTATSYVVQSPVVEADRWHHLALTFGSSGMTLYLDGASVDYSGYSGGLGSSSGGDGNSEPIAIGADASNSSAGSISGYTDPLLGRMLDVTFFNQSLAAETVRDLYEAGALRGRYRAASHGWEPQVD